MRTSMRWSAIGLAGLLVSPAAAAPIELICKGQTSLYDRGSFSPVDETLSVMLDFASGTVTIGNGTNKWTVPMVNRPSEDMVTLAHRDAGVTMGSINRLNGVASFGFFAEHGFSMFAGVCERVPEKLF